MPVEILDYRQKNLITNSFNLKNTDILCKLSSVVFDGQQFSSGDVIVTGFARDDYVFGIIDYVLSFEGRIYLLYENLENVNYNYHVNAYEVTRISIFSLCQPSQLLDYHPLSIYRIKNQDFVVPHHYIPMPVD